MLYSMTGFARSQLKEDWGSAVWELRSVNHRYLDVTIKMPESLRELENTVRERLRAELGRGKVEAYLKFKAGPAVASGVSLNEALLVQLAEAQTLLQDHLGQTISSDVTRLLQWPGLIVDDKAHLSQVHAPIMLGFDEALAGLKTMRSREGEAIKNMLSERLEKIAAHVVAVRSNYPEIIARLKQNLSDKLAEVMEKVDQDRLEQEMVYLAQRSDVAEELDRLDAHVSEIQKVLEREEQIGRRLDFYMQELNREANTLSSKSQGIGQTNAAVDIKVLIEQMREQVQNVE